jgi:hypothetical protein
MPVGLSTDGGTRNRVMHVEWPKTNTTENGKVAGGAGLSNCQKLNENAEQRSNNRKNANGKNLWLRPGNTNSARALTVGSR